MKVTVISGSPKGEDSITLQYVKYLEKTNPRVEFQVFHVGSKIREILQEGVALEVILDAVKESRGVLWAFPVYFFLVPSQLKEFIELLFQKNCRHFFQGKYAALLMTSIHFYDTTACDYMRGICCDLGMRYTGEFMADMHDLFRSRRRKNIKTFYREVFASMENEGPAEFYCQPLKPPLLVYQPDPAGESKKGMDKKVLLLTDERDPDSNLARMADTFARLFPGNIETVNISEMDLMGGCLGCLRCAYDNRCVYRDGLARLYDELIFPADAVIIAAAMKDRYLSARWKMFFDRSFYLGHTPAFLNKQMAFILSGPLSQVQVLRTILEAKVQFNRGNLVGIVTDEYETSREVTDRLKALGGRLTRALAEGQEKPAAFYGVAGHLIFRDFVYRTRGIFRADHLYYMQQGLYDFPQGKNRLMNLRLLFEQRFPARRRKIQAGMVKGMVQPFTKVLEKQQHLE